MRQHEIETRGLHRSGLHHEQASQSSRRLRDVPMTSERRARWPTTPEFSPATTCFEGPVCVAATNQQTVHRKPRHFVSTLIHQRRGGLATRDDCILFSQRHARVRTEARQYLLPEQDVHAVDRATGHALGSQTRLHDHNGWATRTLDDVNDSQVAIVTLLKASRVRRCAGRAVHGPCILGASIIDVSIQRRIRDRHFPARVVVGSIGDRRPAARGKTHRHDPPWDRTRYHVHLHVHLRCSAGAKRSMERHDVRARGLCWVIDDRLCGPLVFARSPRSPQGETARIVGGNPRICALSCVLGVLGLAVAGHPGHGWALR